MQTISFDVPKDFLETIRDFIVKQNLCASGYLYHFSLSTLPVLPLCVSMIRTYFPKALPVDCVIYLGGEGVDSPWHVDTEPGIWGCENYMNLLVPLVITESAAIKVLDENFRCSKVIQTNAEGEKDVNLTVITSDTRLITDTYLTQQVDLEIGKAYIFSGSSPHCTVPDGFRISMIVGFVKDGGKKINLEYSPFVSNEVAKVLATLFEGAKSEEASMLVQRYDEDVDRRRKAISKDLKLNDGWKLAWMIAMILFSKTQY